MGQVPDPEHARRVAASNMPRELPEDAAAVLEDARRHVAALVRLREATAAELPGPITEAVLDVRAADAAYRASYYRLVAQAWARWLR